MTYAFRCKTCGRLHTSDDAFEAAHPHSCCACRAGTSFSANGGKTVYKDNWEVLADATPERLLELGLTANDVTPHVRKTRDESNEADHARCVEELKLLKDKEQKWAGVDKEVLLKEWQQLDAKVAALAGAEEMDEIDERHRLVGRMRELELLEWTDRDQHHKLQLEARIALGPKQSLPRMGGHHFRKAVEGASVGTFGQSSK